VDRETISLLERSGIQPSAQRVAVAEYVLRTEEHPSADLVWARVRRDFPLLSRATVYNTLNLLVERKLLRALVLAAGRVVFDPKLAPHHHFIDESSGAIHDVPWESVDVTRIEPPDGFRLREYQVVMRGDRRGAEHPRGDGGPTTPSAADGAAAP
jgi:Fe2+ or Zn2+ uptake regulation protein